MKSKIHIFGGGTFSYIASHLALSAPAFGKAADIIEDILRAKLCDYDIFVHKTKMADVESNLVTNEDVSNLLDDVIKDPNTKIIFLSMALCDFDGFVVGEGEDVGFINGKWKPRLKTDDGGKLLRLVPAEKIINKIRKVRKDIFLVGFKTTAGATPDEQYLAGLKLLKKSSCNLVLANDVFTRLNMVITPEQARYHETQDRYAALEGLVEMAVFRSQLQFTRSTIVAGDPVPWNSDLVPHTLQKVVNYCIERGAYKPFLGSTVGHFAAKIGDGKFLTSRRKVDFNRLNEMGLVLVETNGDDEVIAHGFKPSVGGQSQRIVFAEHPDTDCIVHFHCDLRKSDSDIPKRSQRNIECGSHQCGKQTSSGLKKFDLPNGEYLYAVMLENHGPNVVFNRSVNAQSVIDFIEENFDLQSRTDGVASETAQAWSQ
jgi:hypothetical protein